MNDKINQLLNDIRKLEKELADQVHQAEKEFSYHLKGKKVEFDRGVKQLHRKFKTNVFRFITHSQFRNIVSAPFIYAMIFPFVLLDISLTLYQHICFRLYRIKPVTRGDYILIDRQQLAYLNVVEKVNCVYCGYANGLLGYGREIAARTEQYWCPIKHARKVLDSHRHYRRFTPYGDAESYRAKQEELRKKLK